MRKLLDRFMSKNKAEKVRLGLDVLFNLLLVILIVMVANNCTFIVGDNQTLQRINFSGEKAMILDSHGNLVPMNDNNWNETFPKRTYYPKGWNSTCSCINLSLIVANCS